MNFRIGLNRDGSTNHNSVLKNFSNFFSQWLMIEPHSPKSFVLLMSACLPRAPVARSTALSICALLAFCLSISALCATAEAKESRFFSTARQANNVAFSRFTAGLSLARRSDVTGEPINCTKFTEGHQIVVKCGEETFYEEEEKDKPGSPEFFRDIALCVFFVLTAGTISPFL